MNTIQGPVHLVGAGGMHMSAIGILLREQGVAVTGSDLRLSPLTEKVIALGGEIREGHDAANVGDATLVVTTAAAGDDNVEIAEARRRGIPVILRAEMVARLMQGKRVIAVAGSHGKTTTSSLVAFILREAGLKPMYLLGGESVDLDGHASWGEGDLCVVEADEYKRAFHEYSPTFSIILNVEADHLDYYGTAEAYHEAFAVFARRTVDGGMLFACADDPGSRAVAADAGVKTSLYGFSDDDEWQARDVTSGANGVAFTLVRNGEPLGEIRSALTGDHFVRNATAAAAVALAAGVDFPTVQKAIAAFRGAARRFQRVGEAGGVLVMDDYAHHPTEVRATISAARTRFAGQRLIGVYQPHTYSRIAYLWDDWVKCWDGLDELVVLETYAARELPEAGRSAKDLAAAITGVNVHYAETFESAAQQAAALAKPGDVVFTIGAGDVDTVGPLVLEALR